MRAVSALKISVASSSDFPSLAQDPKTEDQSTDLVSDIVKAAILDTGYENALKGEKTDEAEARLENLQELVNARCRLRRTRYRGVKRNSLITQHWFPTPTNTSRTRP